MNRRTIRLGVALLGLIAIVAVGWYLASPLFINETVDEPLPESVAAVNELVDIPSEEELERISEEAIRSIEEAGLEGGIEPDKVMEEEMPAAASQAAVLHTGQFVGADEFHQGSGTVTVYQAADGSLLLRLEDFRVTNGPDLHVLLANGEKLRARKTWGSSWTWGN